MANGLSSGQKPTGVADLDSSQTLENKTLDASNAINGAPVTGSDIINPSRLDVKKDTQANLVTYASTASNGQFCFATDTKKAYQVIDAALVDIGSGSSGINYISNPDAEVNTTGWSKYADAAGANAVDGTGGSPNITFVRNTTTPLRDSADFLLTKDDVDRQGEGVSIPFTIDKADLAKKLYISLDFLSSANLADGDIRIQVYDVTNSVLIRCNGEDLKGTQGSHLAWFQSDAVSTSYRLILHVSSVNDTAYTLNLDNVSVGPREVSYGGAMTDTVAYTPTITGFGTATLVLATHSRIGDKLLVEGSFVSGTPTGVAAKISLPTGFKIATTKISGALQNVLGHWEVTLGTDQYTSASREGIIFSDASDDDELFISLAASSNGNMAKTLANAITVSGNGISFRFMIPIAGWSSNSVQSEDIGNRDIRVQGRGNGNEVLTIAVTPITFTETEDTTASWSGTTFTSPESGDFAISGCVRLNSTVADLAVYSYIDTTGTGSSYVINKTLGYEVTASQIINFAGTVKLEKGHLLQLRLNQNATLNNASLVQHNIHIQKKAQPQTILETETVAARYTSNSGQTVPNSVGVLEFEDKDYDTHGAYNTSTGIYTVPVTGKYSFFSHTRTASVSLATNQQFTIYIQKAGVIVASGTSAFGNAVSHGHTSVVQADLDLAKGNEIRIVSFTDVATTLTTDGAENTLSIVRIK